MAGDDHDIEAAELLVTSWTRAEQTVTSAGRAVAPTIDGVSERRAITHEDERGGLCEIYSDTWKLDDHPMVHAYLVTIRPGMVKGWACHLTQVDRYFFAAGSTKLVLFDARKDSPTSGMITERVYSPHLRALVSVPPGVFHAVANVGSVDGLLFNIPSESYNHAQPDKITVPIDSEDIPYSFGPLRGF